MRHFWSDLGQDWLWKIKADHPVGGIYNLRYSQIASHRTQHIGIVIKLYELLPKSWLQKIYFYELLLIIGELDGDPRYGITDYFERLKTRNCTTKTLSTFLNDRIADGDLVLVASLKQSRRTYKLKPELKEICESLVQMPFHDQNQQKTA